MTKEKRENPFDYKIVAGIFAFVMIIGIFMFNGWIILIGAVGAFYYKRKESEAKWVKGW